MVVRYVPEAGDIAWLDFDPQAGREQGRRRPTLLLTDQAYNLASGRVVVCPLTSKRKPYPFALPVVADTVEGQFWWIISKAWTGRRAKQFFTPRQIPRSQQGPHLRRGSTTYPLIRLICNSPSSG